MCVLDGEVTINEEKESKSGDALTKTSYDICMICMIYDICKLRMIYVIFLFPYIFALTEAPRGTVD